MVTTVLMIPLFNKNSVLCIKDFIILICIAHQILAVFISTTIMPHMKMDQCIHCTILMYMSMYIVHNYPCSIDKYSVACSVEAR